MVEFVQYKQMLLLLLLLLLLCPGGEETPISIHDHVLYTEFFYYLFFYILFRDLNFLCGLYGYQISRECLFAESLISNFFFTIVQNV